MKDRWKTIASILERESDLEVEPSYEGWGAGYDPVYLPLLEMWVRGEVEEVPPVAKLPKGVVFDVREFVKRDEEYTLNSIRHEIEYLLGTDLFLWRLGQREFFKFGYPPTTFLVLYSVLESIKTDERIIQTHPSAEGVLKSMWRERLKELKELYPHHRFATAFIEDWLGSQRLTKDLQRVLRDYLRADNREAYGILMDEVFGKYMSIVEQSQKLNQIDLLLEEARGVGRRIMTDVLRKLPPNLQELIVGSKYNSSEEMETKDRESILEFLNTIPEWMRDYLKQMSYLSLVERDVRFLNYFLPKTLETDLEHKGFLLFILKPWDSGGSKGGGAVGREIMELSERDKEYMKEYGLTQKDFRTFVAILRDVRVYVESFRKRFERLLPKEEEGWSGAYSSGRRIDHKKVQVEVPTKRGKFFKRRELPEDRKLAFKLLLDISSSMKKENKALNALKALFLFSEVLSSLDMPFSVSAFNDGVLELKSFEEDYKSSKTNMLNVINLLGGGTNLEKALTQSMDDLELFCRKNNLRGVLLVFSDGEPTRGLKGESLRLLIRELKAKYPVVGMGVGRERNFVEEYFERTGIKISEVSRIPQAFSMVIENYLKRLLYY